MSVSELKRRSSPGGAEDAGPLQGTSALVGVMYCNLRMRNVIPAQMKAVELLVNCELRVYIIGVRMRPSQIIMLFSCKIKCYKQVKDYFCFM